MATRYFVYWPEKDPAFHSLGERTKHAAWRRRFDDGRPFASALRRKRSVSLPDPPCNGGPFCASVRLAFEKKKKKKSRDREGNSLAVLSIHYGFTFLREITLSPSLRSPEILPLYFPRRIFQDSRVASEEAEAGVFGKCMFLPKRGTIGGARGKGPDWNQSPLAAAREKDFSFPRSLVRRFTLPFPRACIWDTGSLPLDSSNIRSRGNISYGT